VKILVADDDAISCRMMERMLAQAGYETLVAENGLDAIEKLRKQDGPRLALLDWMMPELDGTEVCQEVRRNRDRSYIYTVLLTARDSKADLLKAFEAGADDYLTKPCNLEELKARLRTGVRILQLEDELVEAREAMRFEATHDALTALWNRATIVSILHGELARLRDHETPSGVLLCDIDHFKKINDTYGHLAGDAVLKEVAWRLHRRVRPEDAVGRYGGEEFLIILRGCRGADLEKRAEEFREAIADALFDIGGINLRVTMSGGAFSLETWDRNLTVEGILSQADEALYQAKHLGRDRFVRVGDLLHL
jgi:two-component system, cell cycle response regulator